jgi:hypothetical protein
MAKHTHRIVASLLAAGVVVTSLACSNDAPTPARHGAPRKKSPTAEAVTPDYPVIVRVVGRHQTITVTAGPAGPLYSAATNDGETLVAAATLEQLRREHPDLYRQLEPTLALEGGEANPARQAGESSAPAAAPRVPLMMGSVE